MNHNEKLERLRRGARIGERLILALLVLLGVVAAVVVFPGYSQPCRRVISGKQMML